MRALLVALLLHLALGNELVADSPIAAVAQPDATDPLAAADPVLLAQQPVAEVVPEVAEVLGAAPLEVAEPPLVIEEPLLASGLPTTTLMPIEPALPAAEEPVVIIPSPSPVPSSPVPTRSPSAWEHTDYPWAAGAPGDSLDVKFIQDMDNARDAGREPALIFYGDSILQCLRFEQGDCHGAIETGRKRFGKYNYVVAAVGNENSVRVMGRILGGVVPEPNSFNRTVAVLLLGHNEVSAGNADEVADRIADITFYLLDSDPGMHVIPLAMLPAVGSDFVLTNSQLYAPGRELAARLEEMAGMNDRVHFLDCNALFLQQGSDSIVNSTLLPDGQHLSTAGFVRFADCLEPTLDQLLKPVVRANRGKRGQLINILTGPPPS